MTKVAMLIHGEPGHYGASFPDFPGATTAADDLDALYDKAAEMLSFHVGGMLADGLEVPPVRSLDVLQDDPLFREDAADGMAGVLDVDLPRNTVRVNLTMNESDLRRRGGLRDPLGLARPGYQRPAPQVGQVPDGGRRAAKR
ncbi:type II toxin-antitoxin system HicB family antitoxin [Methylobacterium currus]|uniref:type II toxin-antitoxin system HicB family antitoxin n=1 Tax=Methylobacterium currus TaxID=2051553 RepID=UPI001FD1998E|nr:type II toxin-antitoxin system HicB family antitoxin [Methylobacterium currus]